VIGFAGMCNVIENNVEIVAIISKAESANWLARVGEKE
jgi:hypothetical protein